MHTFHPAVRAWFETRFPDGPTPPQEGGWPHIAAGEHTLIAAPTGSGKTLAGFLVCIDQLYRLHQCSPLADRIHVIYVSPLRALATDIAQNLEVPLAGIAEAARQLGLEPPELRVGLRTGDTTASVRASLTRKPPHFLVTTPESLYLLLTAKSGRAMLRSAKVVIVDEIHALARDKRGSHLALSLERLQHVCGEPITRVGLSATQKPLNVIGQFLVGSRPPPVIVDHGHDRALDLALELPESELEAIASTEQMAEILDRIASQVRLHRTTLVFVNTRRLAERVAHLLGERLGEDDVAAHHGSLSKDRRERVEARLRAGELRALVATASLELGIDVGPVELVCQLGSPRSLATFLQRVGRSGHSRYGTPKGRIYPLSRDDLVECTALLGGVRAGRLDAICPPKAPLDILAQQLVAETAIERWNLDDLFVLVRLAQPYAELTRQRFDDIVDFVATGVRTGRGRRGDYVHVDQHNGEAEGRRGARLAAVTSGGAIPELADYRVLAEPDDMLVGTVDEHWATETSVGDVFLLGTSSWRIRRTEPGVVRVVDAHGAPPTVPNWQGEAPGRTTELSEEVSHLRAVVDGYLDAADRAGATRWLMDTCSVPPAACEQLVAYLAATKAVLGLLPTRANLVVERFFDDSGGMQVLVHSPYGARINRAFGLALRKRFCVTFDFELQAAANDDAIVLSLGPQHSFPLEQVSRFLNSATVATVVRQAVLVPPAPVFITRWRWTLNRSLTVLRWKAGRKNPPIIQRMEADDIMAAIFPQAAGCQENVSGPLEIPEHPLVDQTLDDTLNEAMDVAGLVDLLRAIERGDVTFTCRDTVEASPMSHELLLGKPFTFLDNGEANERRTRAVSLRRGLPVDLSDMARLDMHAIDEVCNEVRPQLRSADELVDLLVACVTLRPNPDWAHHFDHLAANGRVSCIGTGSQRRWFARECTRMAEALYGEPPHDEAHRYEAQRETAVRTAVRGLLETSGPRTAEELADELSLNPSTIAIGLAGLEHEGSAIRGSFRAPDADEWCSRRLLARMHVYSQKRRRGWIEPANARQFMRFLFRWQHVHPDTHLAGEAGIERIVEQLQGWESPAAAWEGAILPGRMHEYRPADLDALGHSGQVSWARLTVADADSTADDEPIGQRSATRASRITLTIRDDLTWLLAAHRGDGSPAVPEDSDLAAVVAALRANGARFQRELVADTALRTETIERTLWDGVARGVLTADSFWALRSLFNTRKADAAARLAPGRRRLRRGVQRGRQPGEGRWVLVPAPAVVSEPDELAEAVAEQLIARWGIVVRDVAARERLALPWREVQWALRRLEARGIVRGGRFVSGFPGEQFASPEAADLLAALQSKPVGDPPLTISAADPLNLTAVVTPGPRVPAVSGRTLTYRDGMPTDAYETDPYQTDPYVTDPDATGR